MSDADGWNRLHPLSPVVRSGRVVFGVLVLFAVGRSNGSGSRTSAGIEIAFIVLPALAGVVSWFVTRWRLDDSTLLIETGLLRRSSRRLPLARIQAVDVVQSFLAKVFGLAEIRVRLAGSSRVDGRLAYLREPDAARLREQMLAGQHASEPELVPPPSAQLAIVPGGRLIASVLLSGAGAVSLLIFLGLVVLSIAGPHTAGTSAAGWLVVVGLGLWRRIRAEYGFSVAHVPEGLRLKSGLLQSVTETIPRARVQSLRRVEPLLWRLLGWVRLEVAVASRQADSGGSQSRRATRALLPVGTGAEAEELLGAVLASPLPALVRPPRRAVIKAPLRFHFLGAGQDQQYVVGSTGRVCRSTTVVPLAKVQSIRRTQGPIERRLRLASVFVDVAGRRAGVKLSCRDVGEADRLVASLVASSRAARTSVTRPSAEGNPAEVAPSQP